jgi:hypothetical protein
MEYSSLISITGKSGLYEVKSSKTDGAIVTSLEDGKTEFVSSRLHQFSQIEAIEVYTTEDNVNLVEVLKAMQASSEARPDGKDATALKTYFQKVYPTMDLERVYGSDMKKMIKWLAALEKNNVELKLREYAEGEESEDIKDVKKEIAKPKATEQKAAAPKKAPTQKINAPRKMA